MIQATIRDLLKGKLDNVNLAGIYVIRDNEHVLYVGKSVHVVNRLYEHISLESRILASAIGDLIWENKPQSFSWQIELMTIEDCKPFARQDTILVDVDSAELAMIEHYRPCMNEVNNPHRSAFPGHIKQYQLEPGLTDHLY